MTKLNEAQLLKKYASLFEEGSADECIVEEPVAEEVVAEAAPNDLKARALATCNDLLEMITKLQNSGNAAEACALVQDISEAGRELETMFEQRYPNYF